MTDMVHNSLHLFAASVDLTNFPWWIAVGTALGLAVLIFFLFFFRTLQTASGSDMARASLGSVGIPLAMLGLSVLVWYSAAKWFPDFSFRGDFPWWISIPLAAVLAVLVFFMYFRESMKIDMTRRIIMATLRALTIASILVLCANRSGIIRPPAKNRVLSSC